MVRNRWGRWNNFKNCEEAYLNKDSTFIFNDEVEKNNIIFYEESLYELSSKYKIFKNSTQKLDSLILLNPKHTEIRFLRYLVQLNCPKFLLYDAHIDGDYNLIMSNIQSEPKDLQNFIYTIINQ